MNSVVWGGEDSGVLSLTVRYGSFAEMEQAGEQVAAYTASHGGAPLPQALAAGNLIPEGTSVSTLVAL